MASPMPHQITKYLFISTNKQLHSRGVRTLQFTQVHKITEAFLGTRRAFWRQNPTACGRAHVPCSSLHEVKQLLMRCKRRSAASQQGPQDFIDGTSPFKLHPEAAGTLVEGPHAAAWCRNHFPNSLRCATGW